MNLTRARIESAIENGEIGAFLEGIHVLTTLERIAFIAWIDWPAEGIRKSYWDEPAWLAIRHLDLVDEVQGAILRSIADQWSTIERTTESAVGTNVCRPEKHRAVIAELAAAGCTIFADRVIDATTARDSGVGIAANMDGAAEVAADFISINSGVVRSITSSRTRTMAVGIIEGARSTGAFTYAEEITTMEQLEILRTIGVDVGHGPIFAELPTHEAAPEVAHAPARPNLSVVRDE